MFWFTWKSTAGRNALTHWWRRLLLCWRWRCHICLTLNFSKNVSMNVFPLILHSQNAECWILLLFSFFPECQQIVCAASFMRSNAACSQHQVRAEIARSQLNTLWFLNINLIRKRYKLKFLYRWLSLIRSRYFSWQLACLIHNSA